MSATLDLARKVCASADLDTLLVYDQAKRHLLYEVSGADEVTAALDELPSLVTGTVRVVASKGEGKGAKVYEWVVNMGGASKGIGSLDGGSGPGWREFVELKLENQEQRLRAELTEKDPGYMGQLVELITGLVAPGGALAGKLGVPTAAPAAAPAVIAGPAAADPAARADGELPPEVLAAAANVAKLYRMAPETFAQYAPVLANLVADGKE